MGYISDNLMPNETIIFTAKVHRAIFLRPVVAFIGGGVLFIYGLSSSAQPSSSGTISNPSSTQSSAFSFLLCFSGLFLLYAIILALEAFVRIATTEFGVTNIRVMAKIGFIRRHTLEILLSKVESVSINQSILGRILNFGTIVITGTGGTSERIPTIEAPLEVRKRLNIIIEKYKSV